MSYVTTIGNGKWQTVADLENNATKVENNLEVVDKKFIKEMVNILNIILTIAQRKEVGIFKVILKWFRLYLKLGTIINLEDKKLLKYYEKCAPTIITYIIGCLQYKTNEVPNYHYTLLEILEELMENTPRNVLKEITKFDRGTIGCLWNPIDLAGDFNTQLKALKILSVLLKQFDENRQNEELKYIKWTNLNFFQEKLKIIVQETNISHVLENCSRELLNNYNMNFKKEVMVYSFYCKSVILGNKYKFYKPLSLQKFWIDINYCPKTVSYTGRFKLNSCSKYEKINVVLKIQKMILQQNVLQICFDKPGNFSQLSDYLSNIADNVITFTLTNDEKQRLISNDYVIEYFNNLTEPNIKKYKKSNGKIKSTFDLLKNDMSKTLQENKSKRSSRGSNSFKKGCNFRNTPIREEKNHEQTKFFQSPQNKNISEVLDESPKTSINSKNNVKKQPIRNIQNRTKFFTSFLMEDSCDELLNNKTKKKRLQKTKSRKTKSGYKQVCKVTPTVDLTNLKIENMECIEENDMRTKRNTAKVTVKDNVMNKSFPLINTQVCDEVLKQVSNIYDIGDNECAKPCQSYRNFKTQINPIQKTFGEGTKANGRKKKINMENASSAEKKRKLLNCYSQENKENVNPQKLDIFDKLCPLSKTKHILSPHLFETQVSDEIPSSNKLLITNKDKNTVAKNIVIDLSLDEQSLEQLPFYFEHNQDNDDNKNGNISSGCSIECEEVRGLNENYMKDIYRICTPTKTILTNSSKVTTPRPASSMNISNLDDSDMEITQVYNCQGQLEQQTKIYDKNIIPLQDSDLDMELTQVCCNPNYSQNDHKHTAIPQPNCEVLKENNKVPFHIQQILNDFDCNSDDEFDSIYKNPSKGTIYDIMAKHSDNNDLAEHNYNRDCIVFQNRKDTGECSSSEEDSSVGEFFDIPHFFKCNNLSNQNFMAMEDIAPFLYHENKENNLIVSPDKNCEISKNVASKLTTTCQVTPTAIILHQLQVSEKKSVILRSEKSAKVSRATKCLNDYFTNKNTNSSAEFQRETFALPNQNLHNLKEMNSIILPPKNPTCYTKSIVKRNMNTGHTPDVHNNISKHNAISKSLNTKVYETNTIKNPVPNMLYNENDESLLQQQSSSTNTNFAKESGNSSVVYNGYNILHQSTPLEDLKNSVKKDLLHIIEDYNTNIKLRLDNAMRMILKTISDKYTREFLEITKTVLKKSEENRMELEQIRFSIGRLVRELEWQYDAFINKSKAFDIHREVTERVIESVTNLDIPNCIAKDYEDIIKQLNIEQNGVYQKVWQEYLDKQKI